MSFRFESPSSKLTKDERIESYFKRIEQWIDSTEMKELLAIFGFKIDKSLSLVEKIKQLDQISDIWDYRKYQTSTGERWDVYDEKLVKDNEEKIRDLCYRLGFKGKNYPESKADYILVLGGARLSNYFRPLFAKRIIEYLDEKKEATENIKIVGMASFRMNFPDEIQYLSKYAPEAKTEFDAISRGLEIAFDLEDNFVEEKSIHTNENLSWAVRKYNNRVFSIAAPSSIPTKRANTIDTFEFFMKKFDIKEGDRILLLTASIFVPYQLFRFIPIAIEHGLEVDCLGIGDMSDGVEFLKTSNYLQEIRATVNAIVNLKDRYLYNLTK